MIILKARIGEIPRFIRGYFTVVLPLAFVFVVLYFLGIHLVSEVFHRRFMVALPLIFMLLKRFDYLLLKKVTVTFRVDRIEIEELDMDLPFSEIEGIELTVAGYKGEVSYGGSKPARRDGYGNFLRLKLNEGGTLPLNVFLDDPNQEVALIKCLSGLPDSNIKRLY